MTCIAFAVLRVDKDGDRLFLPVKLAIIDGIVEHVVPMRGREGPIVYESIAFEHASNGVMEFYAQKQIDEARTVKP